MTSSPSVRHGLRAVSPFLLLVFLASCTTPLPGGGQPGPGGADDDDSWAADDDDDDAEGPVEENCDDGLDEDEDSLTDCEDPDCADVFHCTWPERLEVVSHIEFSANELAESFGVGDCFLEIGGVLDLSVEPPGCEECDREYTGTVSVVQGDCPEDYIEPPSTAAYGFEFVTVAERDLWKLDTDDIVWESLGLIESGGAVWSSEHSSPVLYDVPIFGETEVGEFFITETITDL